MGWKVKLIILCGLIVFRIQNKHKQKTIELFITSFMRSKEQYSNGNRKITRQLETHSSSLKQAGMRALNSASYIKDPRESCVS